MNRRTCSLLACALLRFAGHSWVGLVDPEGSALWELRVRFNLTRRADTGRVNTSPTAAFFTEFQLLRRCNQTIQIPGTYGVAMSTPPLCVLSFVKCLVHSFLLFFGMYACKGYRNLLVCLSVICSSCLLVCWGLSDYSQRLNSYIASLHRTQGSCQIKQILFC